MVEHYLRCYVRHQQTDWADLLLFAEVAYNNAVHNSTGFTPFQVAMGWEFVPIPALPRVAPADMCVQGWMEQTRSMWRVVKDALSQAAVEYKRQADKKQRTQPSFQVGQMVYLSTKYLKLHLPYKKLRPKYIGPFPIVCIINLVTVQLRLPPLTLWDPNPSSFPLQPTLTDLCSFNQGTQCYPTTSYHGGRGPAL